MKKFLRAPVNNTIILLNLLVFLLVEITGGSENTINMLRWGAANGFLIREQGEYYRILTSMFLHFGMEHLLNNMLVLFIIGEKLERTIGRVRFLVIYLLGGTGANILSVMMEQGGGEFRVSAGASGAVFAVMGAMIYVLILYKGKVEDLTARQLIIMAALSLYLGFVSTGVDNMAHVGGICSGFILGGLLYRKKKNPPSIF